MEPRRHGKFSETLNAARRYLPVLTFGISELVRRVKNAQWQYVKLFIIWSTMATMFCQRQHLYNIIIIVVVVIITISDIN